MWTRARRTHDPMAMTYREIVPKGRRGRSECVEAGRPVVLETEQIKPGRGQRNRNKRSKGRRMRARKALCRILRFTENTRKPQPGSEPLRGRGPSLLRGNVARDHRRVLPAARPPTPPPPLSTRHGPGECASATKWNVNRGRTHGSATEVAGGRAIITFHVSVLN